METIVGVGSEPELEPKDSIDGKRSDNKGGDSKLLKMASQEMTS